MIESTEAAMDAAHNALTDTDHEYGTLRAYVASSTIAFKTIKAKQFLSSAGTIAERDAVAYTSKEYMDYAERLSEATVELYVLEAKRESWQRDVDIWRTESANQRR